MMKSCYLYCIFIYLLLFTGCRQKSHEAEVTSTHETPSICVTIEPIRYFVEAIAGNAFQVMTIVPKGASPESYDPTPQQLMKLTHCVAFFRTGNLGFEQAWGNRLIENAPRIQVFNLSEGIDFIYGHQHSLDLEQSNHVEEEGSDEGLGIEPHIWTSVVNARIIATNILKALCQLDESQSKFFHQRYDTLQAELYRADSILRKQFSSPHTDSTFMIYHPSLSYFARDYGLKQIPIEIDGKEPSASSLRDLITKAKDKHVKCVFVQAEFDHRNAELIASEVGAQIIPINPLSYDWKQELIYIAKALAHVTE